MKDADILPALNDLQIVEESGYEANWDYRFLSIPGTESGLVIFQDSNRVLPLLAVTWIGPIVFIPKSALNGNYGSSASATSENNTSK